MSSDTLALRGTKTEPLSDEIIREVFGGRLFTDDFLAERLIQLANNESAYRIDDDEVSRLYDKVASIFRSNGDLNNLNEANLQDKVILPIMERLGWEYFLREISLEYGKGLNNGRIDAVFFDSKEDFESAGAKPFEWASLILESKIVKIAFDTGDGNISVPATQILGYLNRVAVLSSNRIQWGMLTNGAEWRLYYQKAQSMAEQFFSVRLDRLFADDSLLLQKEDKLACFKIFLLIFGKQAFQAVPPTNYSFHQLAIDDVKSYQQQITENLANKVFDEVYEKLAIAIAEQAKQAVGEEVKQATLKILYRILFILYAEDRELLSMSKDDNQNYKKHYSLKTMRMRLQQEGIPRASNVSSLWDAIKNLCDIINDGDSELRMPKYNGGLFKDDDIPILIGIEIPDSVMGETLYSLSYYDENYINYRNLNVEQLGSIYENLLERDIIKESGKPKIFLSNYNRKKTGSYYTPEKLVNLVIKEVTEPAHEKYISDFENKALALIDDEGKDDLEKGKALTEVDAATAILNQKICDPAMGSGHFLVTLTDNLTDQVIKAMGEAENMSPEEWNYQSPLRKRINEIRDTIRDNAEKGGYDLNEDHLQDRHIIRRIVLKSCIYGVDKNSTAVELTKLSLWLHTFTVGAPLSFLDHHLKCGDSLLGLTIQEAQQKIQARGTLFERRDMQSTIEIATKEMQKIANLSDSEIGQVKKSEEIYEQVQEYTEPLKKTLSLIHASNWLKAFAAEKAEKIKKQAKEAEQIKQIKEESEAEQAKQSLINQILDEDFGDYFEIIKNPKKIPNSNSYREKVIKLVENVKLLDSEERFFHWEVEFPEVWPYQNGHREGGFDAVIGNPPWDRMKLEEPEWFAKRDEKVAKSITQDARKKEIKKLKESNPDLYAEYIKAKQHTKAKIHVAKNAGIYQDSNKGDINIYRLFVERSRQLIRNDGLISLVVPSGIVFDKTTAPFFKRLAKNKQVKSFYDFRNKEARYKDSKSGKYKLKKFFKNVSGNIKFCIFTHATHVIAEKVNYGCFLRSTSDIEDSKKCFYLDSSDFDLVNPNTGTAPLFRTPRDRKLVSEIYRQHVILETDDKKNANNKAQSSTWDMDFKRMLDATNDSKLFTNEAELKKANCYPIGDNRYKNKEGIWLPLYKGAMFYLHDHRSAKLKLNPNNLQVSRTPDYTSLAQHQDPNYLPPPLYWVKENRKTDILYQDWVLAYRNITRTTDARTFITAILPSAAYENSGPILINKKQDKSEYLLYANFSTIPFDYIARNKIHDVNMAWYIVQQLPVIDINIYDSHKFGNKTAREVIREIILELVYTATDLRGFAKDLGYVDDKGEANLPYIWDEFRRLSLCAKLDAIYFILYGITEDDDIEYIYNTFGGLKKEQKKQFNGTYKRLELCLNYKNALLNGECDIFYEVLG